MSHYQRVKEVHRGLIIADQWTEPHSPWQNPAELNGVKYFKSHAQVLLDRTGAPDNLWFLAQNYLSHVNNLTANRQVKSTGKYQNRYHGEGREGNTRHPISLRFIGLNLQDGKKVPNFGRIRAMLNSAGVKDQLKSGVWAECAMTLTFLLNVTSIKNK
jgi:hypothetical protein